MKSVVFTGGGTGGHIYPGLAIADELKLISKDISIVWIGSNNGKDKTMVESNIALDGKKTVDHFISIPTGKLRRYFSFQNILDVFKIGLGFFASIIALAKIRPLVVFSKGGFVSVPPCAAAKILGIPVYTHECDFSPGLATKLNMRFAKKILLSYEESKKFFPQSVQTKLIITGNPVRDVFFNSNKDIGYKFLGLKSQKKPILLVLGGSSGAHQINTVIFENIDWLVEHFTLIHQTGSGDDYTKAQEIKDSQKNLHVFYAPYDFIYSEMSHVVACSDIVLSRSGANSLWECAALGKPMLLLPLAGSGTRGDQIENAHYFEKYGAAIVIDSKESDFSILSGNVKKALELMCDQKIVKTMQSASSAMIKAKASKLIATILVDELQ